MRAKRREARLRWELELPVKISHDGKGSTASEFGQRQSERSGEETGRMGGIDAEEVGERIFRWTSATSFRRIKLRPSVYNTEAVCFAYAQEKSVTNTTLFLLHLDRRLSLTRIRLEESVIQADNEMESPRGTVKRGLCLLKWFRSAWGCYVSLDSSRNEGLPEGRAKYPSLGRGRAVEGGILRFTARARRDIGLLPGYLHLKKAEQLQLGNFCVSASADVSGVQT